MRNEKRKEIEWKIIIKANDQIYGMIDDANRKINEGEKITQYKSTKKKTKLRQQKKYWK